MNVQNENHVLSMLEITHRLSKDMINGLRQQGGGITDSEARFVVDLYYTMQKSRVAVNNQVKGLDRDSKKAETNAEPHEALDWILTQQKVLEDQIKRILAVYTDMHPMNWFFDQTIGIGPVLAAGLLAHIDIHKAPTVGHIWNFAGLNPDVEWEKKQRRPWNATLKTICWKIGDSFVKVSGRSDAFYGKRYRLRKAYEIERNEAGELSEQASHKLERFKIDKSTDAYKAYSIGKLPPAHIDMRARRWTTKLFLSHFWQRWHEQEIGPVPKPFAVAHRGHVHVIPPPQVPPAMVID